MKSYLKEFWTDSRVLGLVALFAVYLCLTLFTLQSRWTWAEVLCGIVFFFFLEYFTHRVILHGLLAKVMPKAYEGHVEHHGEPTNLEFMLTPTKYSLPTHLVLWILFSLLGRSIHLGSAVMLGTCLYQIFYEWKHFVSHRPIVPMTPWGKWMKKFHLLHHYKSDHYWFGVTHAVLDYLWGTHPDHQSVGKGDAALLSKEDPQQQDQLHHGA